MMYFSVALIVLFLHLLYQNTGSVKNRRTIWVITCILLTIIVGLRSYRTGNDTIQYVTRFLSLRGRTYTDIGMMNYRDIGFYYFIRSIGIITSSPTIFLLITSFFTLMGVFDITYRNSDYPILVLFFYITLGNYLFLFTGIRQALAMSICLISVRFIEKHRFVPFALLVYLASTMHHSALIFLPSYFLAGRKINRRNLFITFIVTLIAYFSYDRLLVIANDIIGYEYGIEELDNGLIFYIVLLTILIYGYINRDYWINSENQLIIMNLGIICAVIWTFRLIGRTAERPSMYWLNLIPVVLTNSTKSTLMKTHSKNDQIVLMAAVFLSLVLFYRRASGLPYSFFFWS